MGEMTGGDAVVATLVAHGVKTLYCLPGVQSDHLFNAIHDTGGALRPVHTRHEQGAGYMALGAALATGRPAAYSVVPGPGFLNSSAALATAYATGARVLCLAGQIPSGSIGKGHGQLHEIPDQLAILRQLTKWAERIGTPAEASPRVAQAFGQLASGRPQPVGLELPPDMLAARAKLDLVAPLPSQPSAALDAAALEQAAQLLKDAERPVIFVGGGAIEAQAELRRLAEHLGAPVVANRHGRGILDDRHALSHTLPGGHAMWKECDVVLAVGTRFQVQPTSWGIDDKLKIIRIEIDPAEMDRIRKPDVAILGDAKPALAALLDLIGKRPSAAPARIEASAALKDKLKAAMQAAVPPQLAYLAAIRDVLPDDGVLIDELTQVGYVARYGYEVRRPRTLLSAGYQGTLGWGVPTALGAKDALGAAPVVSISGDGGFMFNVQELATAVRHRIPAVFVVFNDNAFGNVRRMQKETHGNRVLASDLANPDFLRLAESFGVAGARVRSPEELRPALEQALARDEPALIEVPVGEMPSPWRFIHMPKVRGA
ncbi:acetolactate synthase-1/2/3 large subunit [Rhizobiales bacterium GAS113]|nr:acetolactate synthase-1/2/3 large subunit [Rhizobiales bacterium GAS113]